MYPESYSINFAHLITDITGSTDSLKNKKTTLQPDAVRSKNKKTWKLCSWGIVVLIVFTQIATTVDGRFIIINLVVYFVDKRAVIGFTV